MAKIVHVEQSADITETVAVDHDGTAIVRRSQPVDPTLDAIARANIDGVTEIPGLGRLVAEIPITVAMEFCDERGIAWDKFLYGQDYDAEFKRFLAERQRFAYRQARKLVTVQ